MFKKGKSKFYQALVFSFLISTSLFSQDFCHIKGKIKIVSFNEDYKVKVVDFGEDISIKRVTFNENESGKWRYVDFNEDYKVKFVDFGEDVKVKFVDYNYGCNDLKNTSRYELGSYRSVYVKQDFSDIIESVRRQRNAEYNNAIQKINAYEKVVKKMWTEHKMSDFEEVKIPDGWHNLIYYNGLEYDGIVSEYKGFVSNGYLTNIFTRNRMESLIYGHPKAQIFSPWESIYDFEWAPSFPLKISKKGFAENEWSFAPYLTNPNQKVAPPELGGNLSLWTNKKRGPWEIYINEFRWFGAGFTSYFNGKPQCGQSGTLNQDLVPGIYRITVKKGFKVQIINVTIRENGCTLINPMDK